MRIPMRLRVDAHSPIPIRRQLTEQLKHVIEGGGVPREHALPSIRELAGFLGINPNTVARAIEDLKRSGYVEARRGKGVPVIALLAEAHLETLHRLAQLPAGTRVGVVASAVETGHSLEHSIASAALPNIARVETCPAERTALGRLVRRVDAIVCSTSTAARVRGLVGPTVPVIVDDRALNQRAIQMLGAILGEHDS